VTPATPFAGAHKKTGQTFAGVQSRGRRRRETARVPVATNNLLLDGLNAKGRQSLLRGMDPVTVRSGELLSEAGQRATQVIFPLECSISLMLATDGETPVEAGLIGREGMLGIPLVLGAPASEFRAVVQGSGRAWCIDGALFTEHLERNAVLRQRLHRYVYVRMLQLAQSAACRSFHLVEGRLARWLLMSRDRARSNELVLTHALLAHVLGVRRAGVTIAAHGMQDRNLIRYARGHIELLDSRGLETAACTCYANERKIYARLMG
jgi:CRP-like cAMP-binding protein